MSKALLNAVKRGDAVAVRTLLSEGADPNAPLPGFDSPLATAAFRGQTPIVRLLLEAGAEPDLHAVRSAAYGNHAAALSLVLVAGAPADSPPNATPLLNQLDYTGVPRERQTEVRELLRNAGARRLPDWWLGFRWGIRYGWKWRLRRWLYNRGRIT